MLDDAYIILTCTTAPRTSVDQRIRRSSECHPQHVFYGPRPLLEIQQRLQAGAQLRIDRAQVCKCQLYTAIDQQKT
jgi:hypothetical protein